MTKKASKRILTMLLCGLLTASTASCEFMNIPQSKHTTQEDLQTEEPKKEIKAGMFDSYNSIISVYETIVERRYAQKEKLMSEYHFASIEEELWFGVIFDTVVRVENEGYQKCCNRSFGYARKDLNGDGTDELVLLRGDGELIALFTMQGESPVLLDYTRSGEVEWIDEQGRYCAEYDRSIPNDGNYRAMGVYRIGSNGNMELEIEFGKDGDIWLDGGVCYSYQNGEHQRISTIEYQRLSRNFAYKERFWYHETRKNIGADIVLLGAYEGAELIESHDFYRLYKDQKTGLTLYDVIDKNGMVWYSGALTDEWRVEKIHAGDCVIFSYKDDVDMETLLIFKGNYEVHRVYSVIARSGGCVAYLTPEGKGGGYGSVAIMELYYAPANKKWSYDLDFFPYRSPVISARFIEDQQLEIVYYSSDGVTEKTAILQYPGDNEVGNDGTKG